jgi:nickel-dependent lactate racemase
MILDNIIHLPYGTERVPLSPPRHSQQLLVQDPQKVITPALFQKRLETYLHQNALDLSRPILIIADKTRLCGYPNYLPIFLNSLEQFGMNGADMKIIIGYGTHPRQSDEECLQAYGDVYHRYSFIHHNCQEKDSFKELGRTSRGTPIRFRRDLIDASAIITMGPICHHYFAGYGGGRKLIFPGCGERDSIYSNHGLYLNRTSGSLAVGCQPGILAGNPLAEDLFEIEEKLVADLSIHGILDSHGNLCDLIPGSGRAMFLEACTIHGKNCEISAPGFDTVVASCGGHPKDINFIQSHKAIHNAAMFVQDGGLLLIYAKCCEGIGSKTFLPWFEKGSFEAAFRELAHSYEGNGGTALAMMTKLQRIRIGMVTALDKKSCSLINVEQWSHDRVCNLLASLEEPETIGLIPNADLLVRRSLRV